MFKAPKGTRDLFGPLAEEFVRLETLVRRQARLWGFKECRLPTFEETALFSKSVGSTTDIVEHEMFTFTDRGERSLTLRPEGPAGVVRAYLENDLHKQEGKTQLFYIANMFRAEKPQAGRYREFEQIGFEIFGDPSPFADADLVLLALRIAKDFGVSKTQLVLNSIGCKQCRPLYREELLKALEELKEELCANCLKRIERNPLRVLDCKICQPKLKGKLPPFKKCSGCETHYKRVKALLKSQGVLFEEDPCLVRGLDYYTHTVFEILSPHLGSQAAICGGGRYDGLVELLGGPSTPAVGFAMGVDRLIEAKAKAEARPGSPREAMSLVALVLISQEEAAQNHALRALEQLRSAGVSVLTGPTGSSLKSQMRYANKLEATHCLIVGEEEASTSTYTLKDMASGTQKKLTQDQLLTEFQIQHSALSPKP